MKVLPSEITVEACGSAGFGILQTANGNLPLKSMQVATLISGVASRTRVSQTFRNHLDTPIEATYIFPLPGRDAVTKFEMRIGDQTIDGVLKERNAARTEYEQAIRDGHQAAIAEEERSETFTIRVGNIPAGHSVSIELTLVGNLSVSHGEATYRFPLVVAPRYISGVPRGGKSVGSGTTPDTDLVPDASRVTPPVLLPGFPNPVNLSLEVQFDLDPKTNSLDFLKQLRSSLHSLVVGNQAEQLKLQIQPGERLNRDFILRFPVAEEHCTARLETATDDQQTAGVFSLTLFPPGFDAMSGMERDVVFLLDRSGSMSGWKMVAARRAVARIVDSMLDSDHFSVLAFDNETEHCDGAGPVQGPAKFYSGTDQNRWKNVQWIGQVQARGGTKIEKAIAVGLDLLKTQGRRTATPIVVLITDGQVGGEDATLRTITNSGLASTPQFFSLGIDRSVNASLLTRIARLTDGAFEVVESESQLDHVMDRFHRQIGRPAVTDLKVEAIGTSKVSDLTPSCMTNLFADRPASILGRFSGDPKHLQIKVSGLLSDGSDWQQLVNAATGDHEMLLPLWGRERLRDLEDRYASGVSSDVNALTREIIRVSLETSVLSRFTSFVAVDRSRVVNKGGEIHEITQPVETPSGWPMFESLRMSRTTRAYNDDAQSLGQDVHIGACCRSVRRFNAPSLRAESMPAGDRSEAPPKGGPGEQDSAPSPTRNLVGRWIWQVESGNDQAILVNVHDNDLRVTFIATGRVRETVVPSGLHVAAILQEFADRAQFDPAATQIVCAADLQFPDLVIYFVPNFNGDWAIVVVGWRQAGSLGIDLDDVTSVEQLLSRYSVQIAGQGRATGTHASKTERSNPDRKSTFWK